MLIAESAPVSVAQYPVRLAGDVTDSGSGRAIRPSAPAAGLRGRVTALPAITVTGLGRGKDGIVTFAHGEITPAEFEAALGERAINVHTSSRYATLLEVDARGPDMLVRASVRYYNTAAEIDRLVAAVDDVIQTGPRG